MLRLTRRAFLALPALACTSGPPSLAGEIGITAATVGAHLRTDSQQGDFDIFELPRVLRDELDMRVIDLNTSTLPSQQPADLDRLRNEAEKAGCVLTNLKINRRDLDMASPDATVRQRSISEYKRAIDAAVCLGCRWARPLPLDDKPDLGLYIAGYRELAEHAAVQGVTMLVENWAWLQDDPDAIPQIIRTADCGLSVSPDIGNWTTDTVRWEGLRKTFPLAATCDFKFFELTEDGRHERYDLERCFRIGWEAASPGRGALSTSTKTGGRCSGNWGSCGTGCALGWIVPSAL